MKRGVGQIQSILLERHIADRDERKILKIFDYWDKKDRRGNQEVERAIVLLGFPGWPPGLSKTRHLDRFIDECFRKTFRKGTLKTGWVSQFTDVYKDLFRELEGDNLAKFKSYLEKSRAGEKYAASTIPEFPEFLEAANQTLGGFPGGVVSGIGGLLKSAPFGAGDWAGDWIIDRGKTVMRWGSYPDDLLDESTGYSSLIGQGLGYGVQAVYGGRLVGAIANSGKTDKADKVTKLLHKGYKASEKYIHKGYRASEKYMDSRDGLKLLQTIKKHQKSAKSFLGLLWKLVNDIVATASAKKSFGERATLFALLDRFAKESLSLIAETLKPGEELQKQLQKQFKKEMSSAKSGEKSPRKRRLTSGGGRTRKNLKKKKSWKRVKAQHTGRALRHRRRARKALAEYLARAVVRRLLVNIALEVFRFLVKTIDRHGGGVLSKKELRKNVTGIIVSVMASTTREIVVDVIKLSPLNGMVAEQAVDLITKHIQKSWQHFLASHEPVLTSPPKTTERARLEHAR